MITQKHKRWLWIIEHLTLVYVAIAVTVLLFLVIGLNQ